MKAYDHNKIEKKWQRKWAKKKLYKTPNLAASAKASASRRKFYVLDMFPYPSGEGLHVGHPRGYIGTDIVSRYKKMSGFNVLHPMGFDSFGLPAEQFAIKHKMHPEAAVKKNIKRYKEQLSVIGFNYDWDMEVVTSDPKYYKWTQWIFLQLLKHGLAYESYEPINWCPSCQTGLANEDLENGHCERCGTLVVKKPIRQWVLKITKYADRLLADLDALDWPESVKESQRNWIGRKEEKIKGKTKVTYRLNDWVFSRQRYWGEPIPIIHCLICGVVPVPEKDLPVKLPKVKHYEPTGTGESPLANIDKWVNVKCPVCKGPAKRETNTMPSWAGSSWYYLRFIDPKNKKSLVDKKKDKYWSPVDLYVGGTEHATRHLIYARFWHKFLYDIKAVNYKEPFMKLKNQGLIIAADGRKMSKRWGNVINPDDIVKTYGADTLRIYEMFMGPFDQSVAWNTDSIMGSRRFLERVWRFQFKLDDPSSLGAGKKILETEKLLNKTLKKVTEDIENMSFNTAISSMMILSNQIERAPHIDKESFKKFLQILAPFAPHMAEEIWRNLGEKKSIHISTWPKYDKNKIIDENIRIAVQVNGKVRAEAEISAESTEVEVREIVLGMPEIKNWLNGKEIKRFVYVKGRLANIVI